MHAINHKATPVLLLAVLLVPMSIAPFVVAYNPGDEAQVFGHTFSEEYWTNSSILVKGTDGTNASLTTSYVHVGEFQAFLIAFNEINTTDGQRIVLPYQLFGMHYKTPENKEVFIGAIFAFLLVHNESYGSNNLPDVGNEAAWYIVPVTSNSPWTDVTAKVEPIPATLVEPNHYRFGMRYTNMTARVVSAQEGFWVSLLLPLVTVLFSEIVIQYDITIAADGAISAETLYTIGQVTRARVLNVEVDPSAIILPSMEISAVHYLSVFTSKYNVTRSSDGNRIVPPTATTPLSDNITIRIGNDSERAFDIGLGRNYALYNESTDPWNLIGDNYVALNCLLGARGSDFLLIAWQAPLSARLFAHMAYGLSAQLRATYVNVQQMVSNVGTAFHNSQWWYAVTFPEWNGLRVQQDPTYVAYTNVMSGQTSGVGIIVVAAVVIGVVALAVFARRR